MRKILLVEPDYKNKYPPMGLMKISTYHKMIGDEVKFVKGIDCSLANEVWDRIYVTTLFTFDFEVSVDTINYYKLLCEDLSDFFVGGIMSSLLTDKVMAATGLDRSNLLIGLFTDTSVVGDDNEINVDQLALDYDILEEVGYKYPAGDNYFAYTTRGCPNNCAFCAVPILEPNFIVTNSIVEQIKKIDERYGPKQNLLMLDNNVLNAPDLKAIVDSLCKAGFQRGAKFDDPGTYSIVMMRYKRGDRAPFLDEKMQSYLNSLKRRIKSKETLNRYLALLIDSEEAENYPNFIIDHEAELGQIVEKYRSKAQRSRYIDFNQGVDGRKINDENMEQLARLAINPLRIAFDSISMKDTYARAVETAHKHGIDKISNYMLFNYKDKPEDLYERLKINIELNKKYGIQIFSFPMKYSPVQRTDRLFVGEHWNTKYLRAISAILQVTKGVVAAGSDFFYKAFGNSVEEYYEILAMPREFIMFRSYFENNGATLRWKEAFYGLSEEDKVELMQIVSKPINEIKKHFWPKKFEEILPYYMLKYEPETEGMRQISIFD